MYGLELARRLEVAASNVIAATAHPGYSATNLQSTGPTGFFKMIYKVSNKLMAQSPSAGAAPRGPGCCRQRSDERCVLRANNVRRHPRTGRREPHLRRCSRPRGRSSPLGAQRRPARRNLELHLTTRCWRRTWPSERCPGARSPAALKKAGTLRTQREVLNRRFPPWSESTRCGEHMVVGRPAHAERPG